ncbi:hypothetical protein COT72_03135 [archaeon CG10_big_fil_rev_8_21_14_0_10_43_11]|nr:MAG: hypothetical protein COT72_03135 [archaeon CG10_big_fil_rev_8_21_14_0_10_43_11]
MNKNITVGFVTQKLRKEFESLRQGVFEDARLYDAIDNATDELKKDPTCGTRIKKSQWPKEYITKYAITNLWKYDLPNAWRLIYTIETDEITIMSIVLKWINHDKYERKFKY